MADDNDEYISGEQHAAQRNHKKSHGSSSVTKPVAMLIAAVLLAGLSFYGGIQYQKGHQSATSTTAASSGSQSTTGGQAGGRFRGGQRPTFGSVTAISPTSITVDSESGTSTTFSITSSTTITDSGQTTTTTSDISTGDTVAVIASTSNSTQAARILVNPSFGGGGGNAPTSTQDNGTTPTVTN